MEAIYERITLKICIEASHAKKMNSSNMHGLNNEKSNGCQPKLHTRQSLWDE